MLDGSLAMACFLSSMPVGLTSMLVGLTSISVGSLAMAYFLSSMMPEVQVQRPEVQVQRPEVQMQHPEVEMQRPEVQVKHPEVQVKRPEVQVKHPEVQAQHPEVHFLHIEAQNHPPEAKKQAKEQNKRTKDENKREKDEIKRPIVETTPSFGHPSGGWDDNKRRKEVEQTLIAKEQPQTDIQMRRTKGKMSSGEVCFLPHPDLPRRGRRKRLLPDGEKRRGAQAGRVASAGLDYRYGYNGMEEEDRGEAVSTEIASTGAKAKPGEANLLNTEFRLYDPRLGQCRFIESILSHSAKK